MNVRHVVFVTYGEPPTAAFAPQLAYSWRILLGLTRAVAPIPAWLLPVIAVSRARLRHRTWTVEGYGSSLEQHTREQAAAVADTLHAVAPHTAWSVHVAYEFRRPLLEDVLDRLPLEALVDVVPMYAADSAFTHEISRRTLARWAARRRNGGPADRQRVRVLGALDPDVLADVSARYVRAALAAQGVTTGPDCALVLAAHGTLLDPPPGIDNGLAGTESLADGIAERLRSLFGFVTKAWLNHVYGGRWTEPAADIALARVAQMGLRRVVYFPYGFLADNAESELEGRVALRSQPALAAIHLPCLNASPGLARAVAAQVTGRE